MTTMPAQQWVPWVWQHRVCFCHEPGYGRSGGDEYQGNVCSKCGKYYRWVLLKCPGCGEQYLALFRHPGWCPHYPLCLKCIEAAQDLITGHCPSGSWHPVFQDYVHEVDKMPRPMPNMDDVLNLEISFDF